MIYLTDVNNEQYFCFNGSLNGHLGRKKIDQNTYTPKKNVYSTGIIEKILILTYLDILEKINKKKKLENILFSNATQLKKTL